MDREFLQQDVWPLMKGSAEFALDFMIEDAQGNLVTVPSQSPEALYIYPKTGKSYNMHIGTTMDMQIVRELFKACLTAMEVLDEPNSETLKNRIQEAMPKLLSTKIGKDGTLMEWSEDFIDQDEKHRHVSHLFGLYPGTQITPETKELFEAARKTLEKRGDAGTGWSLAWKVAFWARCSMAIRPKVF